MAAPQTGLPTAGAIVTVLDGLGAWFKRLPAAHGLGQASESGAGTIGYYGMQALASILGDGSSGTPGIDSPDLQTHLQSGLNTLALNSRYDVIGATLCRQMLTGLDQFIVQRAPAGWSLIGTSVGALDALLLRMNGVSASAPAPTADTPTLTPATGGAIPENSTGSRVQVSLVGASDWLESLPSTASTQVAMAAPKSAYTLAGLSGNVPVGVTKLRVYRQLQGAGAGDPYYWYQDVAVTAGTAWSTYTMTLRQPDMGLRLDIQPPSWLQAMALPEAAALMALAYGSLTPGAGAGAAMAYQAMMDPSNVALNPGTDFLGVGTPAAAALFGSKVLGGAWTNGTIQTANDLTVAPGIQGFAGSSGGLQARVTATLSGGSAAVITAITYTYYDATHPPSGTVQTATVTGLSVSLADAIGSTADLGIPAGRLVKTVTALTVTGRTTGTILIEAKAPRTI
ncbi:MAG: hypothetical protein NT029_08315 [Armatimonadetes bacterium]|nr:hypothetical protein [Armatimonadota bacterium]